MIQVKKCEMTLMNKTSHIFEKARTLSPLVLKTDLKYVSVKKLLALLRTKNT